MQTQLSVHHQPHGSYLVGRFHTTKQLDDPQTLIQAIHSEWNLHQGLHITLLGNNLFAMCFNRAEDQQHILDQQPWEIHHHLLILKQVHRHQNPTLIQLSHVPMWFYFTGLHLEHYDHKIIRDIARAVGPVLSIDPEEDEGFPTNDKGFRVRVDVHVLLPLPRGTLVKTERNGLVWVSIVPEKLPSEFCNKCLLIGHQDDEHYQVQVHTPLQDCYQEQPEPYAYPSFYSGTDPRMIHAYDDDSKGKKALVGPFINKEDQKSDLAIVSFIEGTGPRPRVFTQEMVKQLFDYLFTPRGRSFLQRLGLVVVPISENKKAAHTTTAGQSGEESRVLSPQIVKLFSAAQINLSDSARQDDRVHNQNLQTIVKTEYGEEASQFSGYETECSVCE